MQQHSTKQELLSVFEIEPPSDAHPKGRLLPLNERKGRNDPPSKLRESSFGNLGRHYAESNLEEWVARSPESLFPGQTVEVLASQNYAHLPEKIDLLCLVMKMEVALIEAKVHSIGENGGVDPAPLYVDQLSRYANFVRESLNRYPASFEEYYRKFAEQFYGNGVPLPRLPIHQPIHLTEIVLAEGFSTEAISYFAERTTEDRRIIRLVEYRYFADRGTIEFWQVYKTGDSLESKPTDETSRTKTSDEELVAEVRNRGANHAYLIRSPKGSKSVQVMAKLNLAQGRSIRYFDLQTATFRHVNQPSIQELADAIRNGVEIRYRAIPQDSVAEWIEYATNQAELMGLTVSDDESPDLVTKPEEGPPKIRRAFLLSKAQDPQRFTELVKLNMQGNMSINIYDLKDGSRRQISQPSENDVNKFIETGIEISHPSIPANRVQEWVAYGRKCAEERSVMSESTSSRSAYRTCRDQQVRWARDRGLKLQGSEGDSGELAYTMTLNENLFVPLSAESAKEFESGDGSELKRGIRLPKMHAIHSSASIVVNAFEYWRQQGDFRWLATVLDFQNVHVDAMRFEEKLPAIRTRGNSPNLDVVFYSNSASVKVIGVESKFTELYRSGQRKGLAFPAAYFDTTNAVAWNNLPRCRLLAEEINSGKCSFQYLDAAQLIKHLLGLRRRVGYVNTAFQLNYLWFDTGCEQASSHSQELEIFADTLAQEGIRFRHSTYQKLVGSVHLLESHHSAYGEYLISRYGMGDAS